jgi:hypothetical protein
MLDDRYFTPGPTFGTGSRFGNVNGPARDEGAADEEIVVSTNGGRMLIIQKNGTVLTSWGDDPFSAAGDFGFKLSGLALYDIDGDDYDEIVVTGMMSTDPSDPENNNSQLLIFDSPITDLESATPLVLDLDEPGCMGLWIGRSLGECACLGKINLIVGRSQTFIVYEIDETFSMSVRYVSEGLGSAIGAFNSIEVEYDVPVRMEGEVQIVEDWLHIGSSAYLYGFKSEERELAEGAGPHQHQ